MPRAKIVQPAAFGGVKTAILPFPKTKNPQKPTFFLKTNYQQNNIEETHGTNTNRILVRPMQEK